MRKTLDSWTQNFDNTLKRLQNYAICYKLRFAELIRRVGTFVRVSLYVSTVSSYSIQIKQLTFLSCGK